MTIESASSTPKPAAPAAVQAPPVVLQVKPGSAGPARIRDMENTVSGDKLLGAETMAQRNTDTAQFAAMMSADTRQSVAEAPFVGSKPVADPGQSPAASNAARETSVQAERAWKDVQRAGAAQADTKTANLKDASPEQIQTQVQERANVIDSIRHNPVQAKIVDEAKPTSATAKADRSTGDYIMDGLAAPQPGKPGPGAAAAPSANVTVEPEKPRAAAPVEGKAPSAQKDVAFAAVSVEPARSASPVTATVANLTRTIASSPIVIARPVFRLQATAAIAADAKFNEVPVGRKVAGATSQAKVVSADKPIGITHSPGAVIGDNLGTVSAMEAARKNAEPTTAPRAKAAPRPKPASYGATVGTSGVR